MSKILAITLFVLGLSCAAFAGVPTPEIDGATAISAITLITGAALIIKSRKK